MGAALGGNVQRFAPMINTGQGAGAPAPAASPAPAAGLQPAAAPQMAQAQPWNVNTAAAQGLQGAMGGTAQGQNFYSPMYAGAYMNPFQQNVIGGLQQQAGRNFQMGSNALGAQATAAKAFGGSRHGVAQGQMAADVQNALNQQIGNLQYQGYGDALSRAAADQQMRMQAAGQMGNLANLGFGMGQTLNQNLMQQGMMQQALQQQALDRASQQYAGYTGAPLQSLNTMVQALGGTPYGQTQTSTSGYKPGLMDYLGLAASVPWKGF